MTLLLRGVMAVVLLAVGATLAAAAGEDAGARTSLAIGIKAYREGAAEASVEALSGALEAELGPSQSAEALYYRGLAYRALGKPGLAIADLTGAIAVKNGLPPDQRTDAEDNCTAARAEAGLVATESVVAGRPEKRPRSSAREPQRQSFLTTTSIEAPPPAPPPWEKATIVPAPAPAKAQAPAPPPPQAAVPTAFATQVLAGGARPAAAAGSIRLQVARVQTQSEAYALAVRLVSQHGAEFSSDMLKIERAVAENKAPVFLVRLGPFADADQAQKRCSALRKGGFDCVVQY